MDPEEQLSKTQKSTLGHVPVQPQSSALSSHDPAQVRPVPHDDPREPTTDSNNTGVSPDPGVVASGSVPSIPVSHDGNSVHVQPSAPQPANVPAVPDGNVGTDSVSDMSSQSVADTEATMSEGVEPVTGPGPTAGLGVRMGSDVPVGSGVPASVDVPVSSGIPASPDVSVRSDVPVETEDVPDDSPAPDGTSGGTAHGRGVRSTRKRQIIRAEDRQVKLGLRLGDLIIPFVSLGVLVLLVSFIFVPFGTQITKTRASTNELLVEIERNEHKIAALSSVDVDALEERLKTVTLVVRDEMSVSELAIEVESMAVGLDIKPTSAEITNQLDVVSSQTLVEKDWIPEYANTISGPFAYEGRFESIAQFLKVLRLESRTILSMGEVLLFRDMRDEANTGSWRVALAMTGYITTPVTETTIAMPISTVVDEALLEDINRRANKYANDTSGSLVNEGLDVQDVRD